MAASNSLYVVENIIIDGLTRRTWSDGQVEWFNSYGYPHRVDGPAMRLPDGTLVWYLNGEMTTEDEVARYREGVFINPSRTRPEGVFINQASDGSETDEYISSGGESDAEIHDEIIDMSASIA